MDLRRMLSSGIGRVRRDPRSRIKASRMDEKRIAKRLACDRCPGSGAGTVPARSSGMRSRRKAGKGDLLSDLFVGEHKATDLLSIRITIAHLSKISAQAEGIVPPRSPAMIYTFRRMPQGFERDWILLPLSRVEEVIRERKDC